MPSARFPVLWRKTVDSPGNTMKLTLRAVTICAALWVPLWVPSLAQAQEVGATGGALSGVFFNSASAAAKAARNVIDSARTDNAAVPSLDSSDKTAPARVMPFIDGGYGRRRPAVGIDFSFELGEVQRHPTASSSGA